MYESMLNFRLFITYYTGVIDSILLVLLNIAFLKIWKTHVLDVSGSLVDLTNLSYDVK